MSRPWQSLTGLPQDFIHDLRYGARGLRRSPGFAVMVVVTLALGVGANTAIFSLVNAVLLRPLPVRDPGALVLFSDGTGGGRTLGISTNDAGQLNLFSYPLYQRLRTGDPTIELAAQDSNAEASIVRGPGPLADDSGDRADGRCVSANFFSVLGVPAQRGRTFLPDDETAAGANPVVVLSHGYWQRRFGADPAIVGSRLTINGAPYTVVGVTRPGFTGAETGSATDFWVPVTMSNEFTRLGLDFRNRGYFWLVLLGRRRPPASIATVEARANVGLRQFLADDPTVVPNAAIRARTHIHVQSAATGLSSIRKTFREPLLVLMAGVALLFLIVTLNVSHLLLARAINRQHEMDIRTALGASRARLVRQLLAEGLLLSVLGALAGALMTHWLTRGLLALVNADAAGSSLVLDVGADARVAWFVGGLALGTAVVLGLVPALHSSGADLQQALRAASRSVTAGGSRRLVNRVLLISQVAFSLVLLVGAALLAGSLAKLRQVATGFDDEHVLLARVNVQMAGLGEPEALRLYDDIERRVTALPGVRAASMSVPELLSGGTMSWGITFSGTSGPNQGRQLYIVTPRYFDALGLNVLRGRGFARTDTASAQRVAVVNETMAREDFGGRDALGQRFSLDHQHDVLVVGVVSDAHTNDLRKRARSIFYLPAAQPHGIPATILLASLEVRGRGDPALLAQQVRRAVNDARSGLPIMNVRTLRQQVDRTLTQDRLLAILASAFGLAALLLVAVGLYGVIAQWAAQRTREIGVRMALGATSARVRWMVLRQALLLVIAGLAIGIPATLATSRLLKGILFGIRPMDATTVASAALALLAVATLAAYVPAHRASRVPPMTVLRYE